MRLPVLVLVVFAAACSNVPSDEEVEDAKGRVSSFLEAAAKARMAAELLGFMPEYTCGDPRASFVGEAIDELEAKIACATVTHEAQTEADLVHATFPEAGCAVSGTTLKGKATFQYSGGEDRFDLDADFREMIVNDTPLQARAGYGTCSDEKRFWVLAQGELPSSGRVFDVDAHLAAQAGLPIIGGTSLVLNGTGSLEKDAKKDTLTFESLLYEIGKYLPKEGTLVVETSAGRKVKATFSNTLWRLGKVEITIDELDPVTVPIVQ